MDAVRQIIDSTRLDGIVTLPKSFRNKKVEVIIFLNEEKTVLPMLTLHEIDAMIKGSVTESLIGAIPQSEKSLQDYRTERLTKYDNPN